MRFFQPTLLLILLVSRAYAAGEQVSVGQGKDEVRHQIGWPKGTSVAGDRETWMYPEFWVTFQNGRVVSVSLVESSPKTPRVPNRPYVAPNRTQNQAPVVRTPVAPTSVPRAQPAPAVPNGNRPSATTETSSSRPTTSSRKVQMPPAPASEPQSLFWRILGVPLTIFGSFGVLLAVGKIWGERYLKKRRDQDAYRPGVWSTPSSTPPPVVLRPLQPIDTPSPAVSVSPAPPLTLTSDLLLALEWKRFEMIVAAYYRATGFRAELTVTGPDGGVDVYLYRPGEHRPCAYVQCKAKIDDIDVKLVRELFGVMAGDNVPEGYFVTTSGFTQPARDFALGKALHLVDHDTFLAQFNRLPDDVRFGILSDITHGDYTTPTCPRCDVKMVIKHGSSGEFWSCPRFPRCRATLQVRRRAAA